MSRSQMGLDTEAMTVIAKHMNGDWKYFARKGDIKKKLFDDF